MSTKPPSLQRRTSETTSAACNSASSSRRPPAGRRLTSLMSPRAAGAREFSSRRAALRQWHPPRPALNKIQRRRRQSRRDVVRAPRPARCHGLRSVPREKAGERGADAGATSASPREHAADALKRQTRDSSVGVLGLCESLPHIETLRGRNGAAVSGACRGARLKAPAPLLGLHDDGVAEASRYWSTRAPLLRKFPLASDPQRSTRRRRRRVSPHLDATPCAAGQPGIAFHPPTCTPPRERRRGYIVAKELAATWREVRIGERSPRRILRLGLPLECRHPVRPQFARHPRGARHAGGEARGRARRPRVARQEGDGQGGDGLRPHGARARARRLRRRQSERAGDLLPRRQRRAVHPGGRAFRGRARLRGQPAHRRIHARARGAPLQRVLRARTLTAGV